MQVLKSSGNADGGGFLLLSSVAVMNYQQLAQRQHSIRERHPVGRARLRGEDVRRLQPPSWTRHRRRY